MGVRNAGDVNAAIKGGHASELINIAEALQERKLHKITDEIVERGAKFVMIETRERRLLFARAN